VWVARIGSRRPSLSAGLRAWDGRETQRSADRAEGGALGQDLAGYPPPFPAKRDPDGELVPPGLRVGEEQHGHVAARDEEHRSHGAREQPQDGTDRPDDRLLKVHEAIAARAVRLRVLLGQPPPQLVEFPLRLGDRGARPEPCDRPVQVRVATGAERRGTVCGRREGNPERQILLRELERGRGKHTNDCVGPAVQQHRAAYDGSGAPELALPAFVGEERDIVIAGDMLVWEKRATQDGWHPECFGQAFPSHRVAHRARLTRDDDRTGPVLIVEREPFDRSASGGEVSPIQVTEAAPRRVRKAAVDADHPHQPLGAW